MSGGDGVVSVCIPAYQSEPFIDRTLHCARAQTYEAQRIVVAVDSSDDGTEERCRAQARDDERIVVHAHGDRLGWVDNVNFLLDSVTTEFAFIYFHDDLIEPTYTEQLVGALRARPDAASAHTDVLLYGEHGEQLRPGCTYDGSAAERLFTYFVNPNRGALLRSMVRSGTPTAQLRMSVAAAVYEMAFVAAGPSMRVAEPLYRRWEQRTGGLTDSWWRVPFDQLVQGVRFNAGGARDVIEALAPTAAERAVLEFGLALYLTNHLRWLETNYAGPRIVTLDEVLDAPAALDPPAAVAQLPQSLRALAGAASDEARRRTAARERQLRDEAPNP
jgi:glycosyl transferase family 2